MITADRINQLADYARKEKPHQNPLFPPSLYYRFMKLLAADIKPTMSVVLGVCGGGDCLYLLEGYKHSVQGIDIACDHPEQINAIHHLHPAMFTFVLMDSVEASIMYKPGEVDILFIDTVHTYERTMLEYHTWLPKMKPNGVILLDDLFRGGMQQAWDEIPGSAKIRRDDLHISGGAPDEGGFGIILL